MQLLRQKGDSAQQGSGGAEFRRSYLGLAPARPRVLVNVLLHGGDDDCVALHGAAAEKNDLWIVGVDQRNRVRRPYVDATIAHGERHGVAGFSLGEELAEADFLNAGQRAAFEAGPLAHGQRHRPSGGFRFGTADVSAMAEASVEFGCKVSAETAGMSVN